MTAHHHPRVAGIVGALLALMLAAPVLAHAELASSSPRDGEELEVGPTTVELRFSEGLDASRSSFRLQAPGGHVDTVKPTADGVKRMALDEETALAPGQYILKWTAASLDGHVERGTLSFTVLEAPSAPPSATASASHPPATAPASTAPTTDPTEPAASPVAAPVTPAASGTDVVLPIVAALILVGGVGVLVTRRSRGA